MCLAALAGSWGLVGSFRATAQTSQPPGFSYDAKEGLWRFCRLSCLGSGFGEEKTSLKRFDPDAQRPPCLIFSFYPSLTKMIVQLTSGSLGYLQDKRV